MNNIIRENRASEEYARNIFESLYYSKAIRIACARLLAESIRAAHLANPSSWSITLYPKSIRLNVGSVEVLFLRSDEVYLVAANLEDKHIKLSKLRYRSVKINQQQYAFPPEEVEEFYPLIAENHKEFIQAAAKRGKARWPESFSLGVIYYLNNLLKTSLPLPTHVSNNLEKREILSAIEEIEKFKDSYKNLPETTRKSIIQSRIGQGQFRTSLIEYWQGCSVSGCQQIELLKASHIKPWRYSTNTERLDIYNGLLLLPNLDTCFDLGLISFDDVGKILISRHLMKTTMLQLGINSKLKLLRMEHKHKDYLRFHRENVFRG